MLKMIKYVKTFKINPGSLTHQNRYKLTWYDYMVLELIKERCVRHMTKTIDHVNSNCQLVKRTLLIFFTRNYRCLYCYIFS